MPHSELHNDKAAQLRTPLEAPSPSTRLQAALTAVTKPAPAYIDTLIERCAIEPDFYVRDLLPQALIPHEPEAVVPRLLPELCSEIAQARGQALHTLSKIGDPDTWPEITAALPHDSDDEVARTAWRTAAGLVPDGHGIAMAEEPPSEFA